MKKIILASNSPRRREILLNAGFEFDVEASSYEEDMTLNLAPHELAKHLSEGKAKDVAKRRKQGIVIGADTIVVLEGEILGKPRNEEDAKKMLRQISGKQHFVITGFTIIDAENDKVISKAVETKVYIRELSEKEINDYVQTKKPLDRAGAYGIQDLEADVVEKIEGDYLNVVGLPLNVLVECLKEFDVEIP